MFAVKKKVTKALLGPKRAKKGPNLTIFQFNFKDQLKMMLKVCNFHCFVGFSLLFKIKAKKVTYVFYFSLEVIFCEKNCIFFQIFSFLVNF